MTDGQTGSTYPVESERNAEIEELREREAGYRGIFEAAGDSLVITDMHARIVEVNPAACTAYGYSREELIGLDAWSVIHPDYHAAIAEALAGLAGAGGGKRTVSLRTVSLRKDGSSFINEGYATGLVYRGQPHILTVGRDVTARVTAEEQLREKEEQYRDIFEATSDSMIIADRNGYIVEVNGATCDMYNATREEMLASPHPVLDPDDIAHLEREGSVEDRVINRRRDGTPFYIQGRATPFTHKGEPHFLIVGRDVTEQVEAYELLERRVSERTQELRTLLDVSRSVGSTLDLQPLLRLILDQLNLVVENDGAGLLMREGDDLVVLVRRTPGTSEAAFPQRYTVASHGALWEPLNRGEPVIVDDVRGETPMARTYQQIVGPYLETAFTFERSFMAVPMMLKDRLIGLLSVSSSRVGYYTPHHAALALALAQQAAIAIENARLYEKAQELAALEERQRLARELHDSVTQALFGINVAAHTARAQLERDPQAAAGSIEYLRSLAQGGMAEMRALLFELRPESLESEGLAAALRKITQALSARHEIPIELTLCDEPRTPLSVKEALYRIAQEALNNTFKHARPTRVAIRLFCSADEIVLEVEDNGAGFDASAEYPGHLGLHSMRERAVRLDGSLDIRSVPDGGTRIRACVPIAPHDARALNV